MLNSKTGNGLSVITSLGQKVASLLTGSRKKETWQDKLSIVAKIVPSSEPWGQANVTEYFIVSPDGNLYAGPYSREKDAKGQITRIQKNYTPGAKRPTTEA